jgi:hydroxymethylpyrimidine kinase/phosphomethylpyrimidine kinase/thiamine-phosphate diphosphorylase
VSVSLFVYWALSLIPNLYFSEFFVMSNRPLVLNFSASDSAGLAGMAMDIRSQCAMGVHSLSVVTANTAQNNDAVISVNPVDEPVFNDQLSALAELPFKAIKVGLLGAEYQCERIADFLLSGAFSKGSIPVVFDPVLGSSSGSRFLSDIFIDKIKSSLLPMTSLLTPNIAEAERLSGHTIRSHREVELAANTLLGLGVKAVLIKGGHFEASESDQVEDYFSDGARSFWLSNKKIKTHNSRGTGCALSSSIASSLALHYSVYDAVVIGRMAISQALRQGYSLGRFSSDHFLSEKVGDNRVYGPVCITHFPNEQIDLPCLTRHPLVSAKALSVAKPFPECNQPLLGLYPVVDRAEWIKVLAESGITTIQLREKTLTGQALEAEIVEAIRMAQKHNIRLFINDHWQLAVKHRAYGVHLGQEDLDDADIPQIQAAGLRLGISTHCHYEVARAHAHRPSYIACGPVYHTNTKDMPWVPHGLKGLSYWRKVLQYPLVAIGGINQARFDKVAAIGVDSVAMITAITLADEPAAIAKNFSVRFEKNKNTV